MDENLLDLHFRACQAIGVLAHPGVKSESENTQALAVFDEILALDESGAVDLPAAFAPFAAHLVRIDSLSDCQPFEAAIKRLIARATVALAPRS
jgi:hypothetical protein